MTLALTKYERRRMERIVDAVPDDADRILDVGCARHSRANRAWGNLHAELHRRYLDAEIIGIDNDEKAVNCMDNPGYDVRKVDAMSMEWREPFDAIVAGDLIEHLANLGRFLHHAALALRPGGRIIVSTPNPAGYRYVLRAAAGNWTSPGHTCWIDPQQMGNLAEHAGLEVSDWHWVARDTLGARALQALGRDRLAANGYVAVME